MMLVMTPFLDHQFKLTYRQDIHTAIKNIKRKGNERLNHVNTFGNACQMIIVCEAFNCILFSLYLFKR